MKPVHTYFALATILAASVVGPTVSAAEIFEISVSECMIASYSYTDRHPGIEPRREWQSGWMIFRCDASGESMTCDVENTLSGKVNRLPMTIVEKRITAAGDVLRAESVSPAHKRNHVLTLNLSNGRAVAHVYEPALETYYDAICHGTFRTPAPKEE